MKESIFRLLLSHANTVIASYKYPQPAHLHLKNYFPQNKQLGSKDRRLIKEMVYSWFRLGFSLNLPLNDQIEKSFQIIAHLNSEETTLKNSSISEIVQEIDPSWSLQSLFHLYAQISDKIDRDYFVRSCLFQPLVWFWVKNQINTESVLKSENIAFIRVNNAYGVNQLKIAEKLDNRCVVQDLSSQLVSAKIKIKSGQKVWDCCAASGGKSIYLQSNNPEFNHYVSDIRESIIHNLHQRFQQWGIKNYASSIINLEEPADRLSFNKHDKSEEIHADFFDHIVADVPCSGSGTWGRNPEHLAFMNKTNIEAMAMRQFKISENAIRFLKTGGHFHYVTCSVFTNENEENCKRIEALGLHCEMMEYVKGYDKKCDTLFYARFVK